MPASSARFLAGAAQPNAWPRPGLPEVAIAGRSNVGKSTLLNRLVGRKALARVSKTPGRTQQINFFEVDRRLVLVDLPGYGFARVPQSVRASWKTLVESYLCERRVLRGVALLVDLRRGLESDDAELITFLQTRGLPLLLVATKADKVPRGRRKPLVDQLRRQAAPVEPLICSGATGEGVPEVWKAVCALALGPAERGSTPS